jgi:hypothetical protein
MESLSIPIDASSEYRVGYPRLKTLPLRTVEGIILPMDHRDTVTRLLHDSHVHVLRIEFAFRTHGHVLENDKRTILVTSDITVQGQREAWIAAAKSISQALASFEHQLEIIDVQADKYILTKPILTNEISILNWWRRTRGAVLEAIRRQQWEAIDLAHRGIRDSEMKPTVIITAMDTEDVRWYDNILPQVKNVVDGTVNVELVHGHVWTGGEDNTEDEGEGVVSEARSEEESDYDSEVGVEAAVDNSSGDEEDKKERRKDQRHAKNNEYIPLYATKANFSGNLTTGVSFSTKAAKGTGTLGGLMEVAIGGDTLKFALTNYHVVFSDSTTHTKALPPHEVLSWKKPIIAVSPSDSDTRSLRHSLCREIRKLQIDIHDPTLKERATFDQRTRDRLDRLRKDRDGLREDLSSINSYDRAVGTVYAASGTRDKDVEPISSKTGFAFDMDWALVLLLGAQSLSAEIPTPPPHLNISRGAEISCWKRIEPETNYRIAKVGRSSRWTRGTINAAQSCIHIKNKTTSLAQVFGGSLAFTLVSYERGEMVISPGDSGSLILLDAREDGGTAAAVGVGFSGNEGSGVSYMTSLQMIIDDIEEVTGGKVTFPELAGDAVGLLSSP